MAGMAANTAHLHQTKPEIRKCLPRYYPCPSCPLILLFFVSSNIIQGIAGRSSRCFNIFVNNSNDKSVEILSRDMIFQKIRSLNGEKDEPKVWFTDGG